MKKKRASQRRRKTSAPERKRENKEASADAKPRQAIKQAPNWPRIRALFSLRRLSGMVQSDVMSDGLVPEKYAISTHRPATLGPNIKLPQDQMLAAFRDVLAGKRPKPLKDEDGKTIKATVTVEPDGMAKIKVAKAIFAFAYAGLLSSDPQQRLEYLEIHLRENTLASNHADALRSKVVKSTFSDEDFLSVVEVLLTTQESFVQSVKAALATRELTNSDLLPNDLRHWDNLVAPLSDSQNS